MANSNGEIELYGSFRSKTDEHKTAYAAEIYDETLNKYQSQLNIQADSIIPKLRGYGMLDGNVTYEIGKDPVFYCGGFNTSYHGEEAVQEMNKELDKYHSPNYPTLTYTCNAAEDSLRGTRYVPSGLCHINLYGSHIWFINNVMSYADDNWTQIFFNVSIGDYTDEGQTKKGIIFAGSNIAIRRRIKANEGDEKCTLWSDFYEIPYNIDDVMANSFVSAKVQQAFTNAEKAQARANIDALDGITQEEFDAIFND